MKNCLTTRQKLIGFVSNDYELWHIQNTFDSTEQGFFIAQFPPVLFTVTVHKRGYFFMTQCELIIDCFKRHGGTVTLGQRLSEGYGTFGHKVTARISELRQKGYSITCTPGPNPSQNLYTMAPPKEKSCVWDEAENGDYWEASCGLTWCFEIGNPKENQVKFCPKCGKKVKVKS